MQPVDNHHPLLSLQPLLLLPRPCARRRVRTPGVRDAGQKLVLYGLLWLTIYDACFVFAYVGWWEGLLMLLAFPIAWLSVQLMRWWSKFVSIAQPPAFKRVRA